MSVTLTDPPSLGNAPGRTLTRTLEYWRPGAEKPKKITVSVSAPEHDPKPRGDYRVLLTINGFGTTYKRYHYGVDPIQALRSE